MKTTIHPLYEGTFSVGLDKEFRPMEREGKPARGALRIAVHAFLIKAENRNILIDVGIGELGVGTSIQTLFGHLEEHEVEPDDITDIFLSHLHFDHIGGLAHREHGFWEMSFPFAKVWTSKKELDKVLDKGNYYDDVKTEFFWFLHANADWHYYEDVDGKPYPEFEVEIIGGHTEFSVAIWYSDNDIKLLMAGDVLPTKGHVNKKFAAKYDFDPKRSVELRGILAKRIYEEDRIVLAYHSSETPLFRLSGFTEENGFVIQEL